MLNAAKFVYSFPSPEVEKTVTNPLDLDVLAELDAVVSVATKALDDLDHAKALEATEQFFWVFCDDYLEVVKERAYGAIDAAGQASAATALRLAIDTLLRLFAPFIPFATEEVWSWTHDGSVHVAGWPTSGALSERTGLRPLVSEALIVIRRTKTDAKASQKTIVTSATLSGPAILAGAIDDLKAVGKILELTFVEAPDVQVTDVVLEEQVA